MNEEKELLTVDSIIEACRHSKKLAFYALIIIWTIMILVGLKYNAILGGAVTAVVLSLFVLLFVLYNSTKERCINNKRLEIKDDVIEELIEVSRHESEDFYVVLKNTGKDSILYADYKDMEIKDSVYVFEYLDKKGKCLIRNIYLQKKYRISPELFEFYKRSGVEMEGFYE